MAIATISPSTAAPLTSGFSYPAQSVFRLRRLARSNWADHPRWYVGHRDYSRLRCGVSETQLRLSASDARVEPMIRALRAPGVRDLPFACFTSAKGNVASPARTQIAPSVTRVISDKPMSAEEWNKRYVTPNGQYRHGERTKAAIGEQRKFSALQKMLRAGLT
jgi:hypothetical protein